ncbi:diacylglycerol kinase family enzyme [Palleronia aestuarii]|uniref:Diacylglycerol kinase family enzyme n=1 Tax=Palleronia aestuarii TaxID=568105 RepID=A0A2W7NHC1_9RHOB|nr:diacylglycerol kinase family protein [Palleronia aestuarii]PZX19638.1 diacylglycerol kinase family enzyme [Palleronia aestuarii]
MTAHRICVIANEKSGQNSRDQEAITRAMDVFGDGAWREEWSPGSDPSDTIDLAIEKNADLVVAAGGDGTAMAVAAAMVGRDIPFAVLPLGTFNFFTRGLGLSEVPEEAAEQILGGESHDIHVGMVNGQVFLNNASLGIYPAILKERESVYKHWGRRRIAAHWSVLKTFLRFRRPMKLTMTSDDETRTLRTALVFVARSAYQLEMFGIEGRLAIENDAFAVLVARASTRRTLFQLVWRLTTGSIKEGRDYDLIKTRRLEIDVARRKTLLAFDGEKRREKSPFKFRMSEKPLRIILPKTEDTTE